MWVITKYFLREIHIFYSISFVCSTFVSICELKCSMNDSLWILIVGGVVAVDASRVSWRLACDATTPPLNSFWFYHFSFGVSFLLLIVVVVGLSRFRRTSATIWEYSGWCKWNRSKLAGSLWTVLICGQANEYRIIARLLCSDGCECHSSYPESTLAKCQRFKSASGSGSIRFIEFGLLSFSALVLSGVYAVCAELFALVESMSCWLRFFSPMSQEKTVRTLCSC